MRSEADVLVVGAGPVGLPLAADLARRRVAEGADLATPPTLALLAETIAPMLPPGTAVSDLRWASFYRVSHRIVPCHGAGRVFSAGAAAHIHPPIGGQGMNTRSRTRGILDGSSIS